MHTVGPMVKADCALATTNLPNHSYNPHFARNPKARRPERVDTLRDLRWVHQVRGIEGGKPSAGMHGSDVGLGLEPEPGVIVLILDEN